MIEPRRDGNRISRLEQVRVRRVVDDGDVVQVAAEQREILDVEAVDVGAVIAPQNRALACGVDVFHQRAAVDLDGGGEDDDFEHGGHRVEELLEEGSERDEDVGVGLAHGVGAAGDVEIKRALRS